jgi:hypothetical protein
MEEGCVGVTPLGLVKHREELIEPIQVEETDGEIRVETAAFRPEFNGRLPRCQLFLMFAE